LSVGKDDVRRMAFDAQAQHSVSTFAGREFRMIGGLRGRGRLARQD